MCGGEDAVSADRYAVSAGNDQVSTCDDAMSGGFLAMSADADAVRGRSDGVSAAADDMSEVPFTVWARVDRSGVPGS